MLRACTAQQENILRLLPKFSGFLGWRKTEFTALYCTVMARNHRVSQCIRRDAEANSCDWSDRTAPVTVSPHALSCSEGFDRGRASRTVARHATKARILVRSLNGWNL